LPGVESIRPPRGPIEQVLFDHGTPKELIRALPGHNVQTAQANGWDPDRHGQLLPVEFKGLGYGGADQEFGGGNRPEGQRDDVLFIPA
jgi:hypothetical protein